MPKRPRTSRRPARGKNGEGSRARAQRLLYKVVELSTVDEGSLEEAINHWVRQGWNLDGVQFAMRESSKRPSMAFVFFTRDDLEEVAADVHGAQQRLRRLATAPEPGPGPGPAAAPPEPPPEPYRELAPQDLQPRTWPAAPERSTDPWRRLEQLASDDEEGDL